ncbi:exodeoxyribonuclease III [Ponticaulis sp.]|uniref:exodeoxyribonuclease III n=1 Tax=Ponticaulis sp. TaxID=2020902 RepID=UPI000B72FB2E|nr:exodeoxyribonuclease III [Ponticaulis sp.]MAI91341.1 exodeoxyribonuclease III [Ponticaulis sp.]OUX97940.1 MAG: exodeoxyribonuclease III [Hyphomonadaceae bacterium TMED5]|tara:strand:- start:33793 stop:34596 length:804 start_codon:yes stop_codon:yes gene_type:complete
MSELSVVTWNINSVRLRANRVAAFLKEHGPDVLCLQEIKCHEAQFPASVFREAGYEHMHIAGQKGLHGVATVSRLPLEPLDTPEFCNLGHARIVASRIDGYDIHNIYLPAGGDEPDPEINEKFAHKLEFLDRMEKFYGAFDKATPLIVVGDLNIAPFEHDVWSHKQLLKIVSHTPVETEAMARIVEAGGFNDLARREHAAEQKLYTWWSYRSKDWAASNRGRRLDHIWANPAAEPHAKPGTYHIYLEQRGGEKPSDHAPVQMTFGRL